MSSSGSGKRKRADHQGGRSKRPAEAQSFQSGAIKSIHLRNFMCHSNFEIHFTPGLNIVVGDNGSGKSAICVGIQLAFGAKASDTNRGKKAGLLVKRGTNEALIRITLCNAGSQPFEQDIYGDEITVVRTIQAEGPTKYQVLGSSGRVPEGRETNMRQQIQKLCAHWNLKVENPMVILTQDQSKMFAVSTQHQKYEFFKRATQINDSEVSLAKTSTNITDTREQLARASSDLEGVEGKLKVAKQEYDDLEALQDILARLDEAKVDLGWAIAKDKQRVAEQAARAERQAAEQLEQLQIARDQAQANQAACEQDIQAIQQARNEKLQEAKNMQSQLKDATRAAQLAQREVEQQNRYYRQYNQRVQAARGELEALKAEEAKQINAMKHGGSEHQKARAKWEANMRQAQNKVQQAEEAQRRAAEAYNARDDDDDEQALQLRRSVIDALEQDIKELRGQHADLQARIRSAERGGRADPLANYHDSIRQIIQLVEQNPASFSKPPIGPVGLHVKLQPGYGAYTDVLEASSGVWENFIVDSFRDREALRQLCRRNRVQPPRITTRRITGRRYNIDHAIPRVPDGAVVAVDCISPETPADVFNVLCDDVKIASRVFTSNRQFAEQQLMQKRGGSWQYVSREISSIHLQDHSQIMIRGGSYALRPANGNLRLGRLKHFEDQREQIAQWKAADEAKREDINVKQTELAELKRQLKDVAGITRRLKENAASADAALHRAKRELNRVEGEEPDMIEDLVDQRENQLRALQQEIAEKQEEIVTLQQEAAAFREQTVGPAEAAFGEAKQTVQAWKGRLEQLMAVANDDDLDAVHVNLAKAQQVVTRATRMMQEQNVKVQNAHAEYEAATKAFTLAEEKAMADGPMPEQILEKDVAFGKFRALQQMRDEERQRRANVDVAAVKSNYEVLLATVETKRNTFEQVNQTYEKLRDTAKVTEKRLQKIMRYISKKISQRFCDSLTHRGHTGVVQFNHDTQSIEWQVRPDSHSRADQATASDAGQLSGGERSFATLAFLMGMATAAEAPFRLLDEVDVYMDANTMKIARAMLIDEARSRPDVQYIMLTPLMAGLETMTDATIHHLLPPVRNGAAARGESSGTTGGGGGGGAAE